MICEIVFDAFENKIIRLELTEEQAKKVNEYLEKGLDPIVFFEG